MITPPYLYFTIADEPIHMPSLKIIKINNENLYISYIENIIPEDKDNPIKQTQFRWTKTQDLSNYSLLAKYIEKCFPNKTIVIHSNIFSNEIVYSKENLRTYIDTLFS